MKRKRIHYPTKDHATNLKWATPKMSHNNFNRLLTRKKYRQSCTKTTKKYPNTLNWNTTKTGRKIRGKRLNPAKKLIKKKNNTQNIMF